MNSLSQFPKNDNDEIRREKGYYIPLMIVITVCFGLIVFGSYLVTRIPDKLEELPEVTAEPIKEVPQEIIIETKEIDLEAMPAEERDDLLNAYDDYILAQIAMHEAGNQDVLGMAFVIMTVLNRCDYYDSTVEAIVTAKDQYAYPYFGKISDNAYLAIELAREYRYIFKPIAWFQTGEYPVYGEHAFKWGDHYFCYFSDWEEKVK